jgi:hypothetical protein
MKNLIKIFIAVIVLLQFSKVNAQYQEWVSFYNGPFLESSPDTAFSIVVDNVGNSFVTGSSGGDYATVAYDPTGVYLWWPSGASRFHSDYGISRAVYLDIQKPYYDKIYVSGYAQGPVYKEINTIAYYTSNGSNVWGNNAVYSSPYGDCIANMVKCDNEGNVYVTGYTTGNGTYEDIVTLKYDANGQPSATWPDIGYGTGVRVYSGPGKGNDKAYGLSISGGIVYVTGRAHFAAFDNRLVTLCYDQNGVQLWQSDYPGNFQGYKERNCIAADYTNGVYVTANRVGENSFLCMVVLKYNPANGDLVWVKDVYERYASSSIGFFSRRPNDNSPGHTNDIFITGCGGANFLMMTAKFTEDGKEEWMVYYNSLGMFNALAIDASENIYVSGNISLQSMDMITVKYNAYGAQLWDATFNDVINYGDEAFSNAADNSGNCYVTGSSFGVGSASEYTTIKYSSGIDVKQTAFQNKNNELTIVKPDSYQLGQNFPNPFNPSTQIKYAVPKSNFITLKVYDMIGMEIKELVNEYKEAGYYNVMFDGSNLASGVYIYKLISGNFTETKKMILIK